MNRRDMAKEIEKHSKTSGNAHTIEELKYLTDDELTTLFEQIFLKEAGDKTGGME